MSRISAAVLLLFLLHPYAQSAAKRAFTLEDLYRVKSVSGLDVSSDGKSAVFSLTVSDLARAKRATQVWRIGTNGEDPRQLTFHEKGASSPFFSPDGKWISFVSARDGSPNLYLLPASGGEARQLTKVSTGVSDPRWSPDSKWIAFSSEVYPECGADDACNRKISGRWEKGPLRAHMTDELLYRHWTSWKDGTRSHILLASVSDGTVKDLTPGDFDAPPFQLGGPTPYDFSPDTSALVYMSNHDRDAARSTNSDLWLVSLKDATPQPRNLTAPNRAFDGSPRFSPDGRSIAYRLQTIPGYEADRFRLALYDLQSGQTRVLTESFDNWVEDFEWSPDLKAIFFLAPVQGRTPVFRLDVSTGRTEAVRTDSTIDQFALVPGSTRMLYIRRSTAEPAEIWATDTGAGSAGARRLSRFHESFQNEVDCRPAEEMWVEGSGGARIHVFLVKPHGFDPAKKYPLILNVHGGPQMQWTDGFRGDWQVYPGAGYVVAFANPHGSTGYGQAFTAEISGDWGGRVFEDVMKVTDALQELSYVDPKRMGAMGWSYGGYMMNWMAGHTDRYQAIASMMGLFDLKAMYGATEELWFPEWDLKGRPWDSDLYEKWSPDRFVRNFKTPTLIITGERDYRVPYTQSLQFFTALRTMGVPARLIVYSDAGHWPSWYEMALYYTAHLEWFQKYLGGEGPPWTSGQFLRNSVFDRETGERLK
jgi:dipeptidyl aminopeptidase/acylaminoacyl peptidase